MAPNVDQNGTNNLRKGLSLRSSGTPLPDAKKLPPGQICLQLDQNGTNVKRKGRFLRVVEHCAGIPKNNSGQFGTKWTKMGRTPYEWIVFERFLDAEKWQPGPVCHQMDKYRGRTPYENAVSEGFWDTRAGLAPNEPKWDEHLTNSLFSRQPSEMSD